MVCEGGVATFARLIHVLFETVTTCKKRTRFSQILYSYNVVIVVFECKAQINGSVLDPYYNNNNNNRVFIHQKIKIHIFCCKCKKF